MPVLYANRAFSTLAADITNSATSLSVQAGHGARFPTIAGSDYFYVTLDNNAGAIEVVKVTAVSTDTFTIVRAQDGTSASAFTTGAGVELRITKAMIDDIKFDAVQNLTLLNLPTAAFKKSVVAATTANITLSGAQTIDGVSVVAGDRVLVKNQTTASQNGIYVASASTWTRATDADAIGDIAAAVVNVEKGTANGGECWTTTFKATDTIGTTAMNWFEVLYNSGTWAINTSGSAATLTTARSINGVTFNGSANIEVPRIKALDNRAISPSEGSQTYVTPVFTSWANNSTSPYADGLLFKTFTDSTGGNENLLMLRKDVLGMRLYQQAFNSATDFSSFKDIAWTDGTNATGTWTVSTTGSAATLTTARAINGTSFNGSADITIGRIYDTNYRRITNPGGAEYTSGIGVVTGAIAVTLPVGMTNSMVRMTIKVFEYTTNESFEIHCGGYNYITGETWANHPSAYIVGNPNIDRRFTVRFGYDSVALKAIIYIGELASTWSYPQVSVTDVQVGYGGNSVTWTTGWSIGFEATAFKNVTATVINSQVGYAVNTNTANSAVMRDGSGNFSAGTITAALSGNATTATTLATTRTLWGQNFNGSANVTGNLTSVGNITGTAGVSLTATAGTLALVATGANVITASTNSAERFQIDGSGNAAFGRQPQANIALSVQTTGAIGYDSTTVIPSTGNTLDGSQFARWNAVTAATGLTFGASDSRLLTFTVTPGNEIGIRAEKLALLGPNYISMWTQGTERVRIDGSGNVGIGTSSPASYGDANRCVLSVFRVDQNCTIGSYYQSGVTQYGFINSGSTNNSAAQPLLLMTGGTERVRIDTSGNVLIGTSAYGGKLTVASTSGTQIGVNHNTTTGQAILSNGSAAAGTGWYHFNGVSSNNTVQNILIYGNGDVKNANNVFAALSDLKLKENIVDATPKLEKLMLVRVVNYNLTGGYEQHKQLGVIAQELEQVFPGLVDETPDKDSQGNDLGTTTKSVKYSVFVPMLIKAMQEQQAMITALTSRINKLESA